MPESSQKVIELEERLDRLVRTQIGFQAEVNSIRDELARLRGTAPPQTTKLPEPPVRPPMPPPPRPVSEPRPAVPPPNVGTQYTTQPHDNAATDKISSFISSYTESAMADLEKFIGENLISKIGILVLVIGVGIGAKYAIDNNLISPLMRIVLGYTIGAALLGLAAKLKPKYHNFSAVLLSGGMAVMYFITYFAYSAYQLIGQTSAFVLMVMFTVFTVFAALVYARQVVAHIGLVGAYTVPFLLSDDSGRYAVLFAYMAVLNLGILAISIWKHWKALFYTASAFTWLIFAGWFVSKYSAADHFYPALIFTGVFFAIFYATKIVHGVVHHQANDAETIASTIVTGVIFYSLCLAVATSSVGLTEYIVFFSFLATAALVILLTSYRYYGRVMIYLAYPFTWLIFGSWFVRHYDAEQHFALAAIASSVLFAVFYGATLVYRLVTDELGIGENAAMILTNSFIFYGAGYAVLDSREALRGYEGLFTVGHGAFHSLVSQVVSRLKPHAEDIIHFLTILILTFATIAVPIQFDGKVVTLIWSVEAALLFAFGRIKGLWTFENFSFPVMAFAVCSLLNDWVNVYFDRGAFSPDANRQPFLNGEFVTALVFVAAFAAIYAVNRDQRRTPAIPREFVRVFGLAVGAIGVAALYNMFRMEIGNYYQIRHVLAPTDADIGRFNYLWQLNYTMAFLAALTAVNIRKVRSEIVAFSGIGLSVISLFALVTAGMEVMHELRLSAVDSPAGWLNIAIRYVTYLFAAGLIVSLFTYSRSEVVKGRIGANVSTIVFDAILYLTGFIVASCELVNLMGQYRIPDATKLGLSILWGVYALMLIVIGIAKGKKYLRVAAIVILGVTLAKLFFYDVADLGTIPKTILFVSLGTLLLLISFLYNKYIDVIFGKGDSPVE